MHEHKAQILGNSYFPVMRATLQKAPQHKGPISNQKYLPIKLPAKRTDQTVFWQQKLGSSALRASGTKTSWTNAAATKNQHHFWSWAPPRIGASSYSYLFIHSPSNLLEGLFLRLIPFCLSTMFLEVCHSCKLPKLNLSSFAAASNSIRHETTSAGGGRHSRRAQSSPISNVRGWAPFFFEALWADVITISNLQVFKSRSSCSLDRSSCTSTAMQAANATEGWSPDTGGAKNASLTMNWKSPQGTWNVVFLLGCLGNSSGGTHWWNR